VRLSAPLSLGGIVRAVHRAAKILTLAAMPMVLASAAVAATKPSPKKPAAPKPKTVVSRHLWATVDACNAANKPGMIGIRGSMPGTGRKDEKMYMRFRIQYQSGGAWHDIGPTAETGYRLVGAATFKARQSGQYFTIPPVAGTSYVLRGVVDFQWRKGTTVELIAREVTTAGHISVAGADPAGYSAAACSLS
jgi:hypothetical protein